jgi:hypothetical protein
MVFHITSLILVPTHRFKPDRVFRLDFLQIGYRMNGRRCHSRLKAVMLSTVRGHAPVRPDMS